MKQHPNMSGYFPYTEEVEAKISLLKRVGDNPNASLSSQAALNRLIELATDHQSQLMALYRMLQEVKLERTADVVLRTLVDRTSSFHAIWLHWQEIGDREEIALYALQKYLPTIEDPRLCEALFRQYGILHARAGELINARAQVLQSLNRP